MLIYQEYLNQVSNHYVITAEQCHALVSLLYKSGWKRTDGVSALLDILRKQFSNYTISIREAQIEEGEEATDELIEERTFIVFKLLNREWQTPLVFFSTSDTKVLLDLIKKLVSLEYQEWTLQIIGKERSLSGSGILQLIHALSEISKPYMNIQRYKGLGEMNPEQLWETSMDAQTRSLLHVTIEDVLEADGWFTTLMGEDVSGRKQFIEEYGHFVKNLDV